MEHDPLKQAKLNVGGAVGLAAKIGVSSQAISQWKRVPAERVIDVEKATGVSRHLLRPDIYPEPHHQRRRASKSENAA